MELSLLDGSVFYKRTVTSGILNRCVKAFVRTLLRICFRLDLHGLNHIPAGGAFLVCPNHLSDIDPLLLYAVLPEQTLYIAYERNFRRPPLSWIISYGRVLLTSRGGKTPKCFVLALRGLREGFPVCVFPEGGRTTTGVLMEPRAGAGILSTDAKVPILPVLIEGSDVLLSPSRPGFRFGKIRISFGEPIHPVNQNHSQVLESWKESIQRLQKERGFGRSQTGSYGLNSVEQGGSR